MGASIAAAGVHLEGNGISLPLRGAVTDGKDAIKLEDGWHLRVVARAIDRTMPRKEAASYLGITEAQLSRQLAGDGHLSCHRLGAMPKAFFAVYREELGLSLGLDDRVDRVRVASEQISRGIAALVAEAIR